MLTTLKKRQQTAAALLLFLFGPSLIAGVSLSPSCIDGTWEVLAEEETHFHCTAEGDMQWTLLLTNSSRPISLATCNTNCITLNTYQGLFAARITDLHTSTLTINPKNNRKLYDNIQLVNGSLECNRGDMDDSFAGCGLNFVYPPNGVSCTALNTSWAINVSCVIGSVYSSRKLYTCSLIRTQMSKKEILETVTMVTSSTSERITKNEIKVSGSCWFYTTLPPDEGKYGFLVSVSPGGRHFNMEDKLFTVEQPGLPAVSCGPHPYVLENTRVFCTCSTSSLGVPAGYLRWVTGNQLNQGTVAMQENLELSSKRLDYSHILILSDHGRTWFRCDVIWATEEIRGENYTANVGYPPKTPHFSFNNLQRNQSVNERDQVNFLCESDGRPRPIVSIYNNDNDTVIIRHSSPVTYSFIARCEDTATYTCSAWNEFSNHSGVTTSYSLEIGVNCKPRSLSFNHLGTVKFGNKTQELNFEVITYPAPNKYDLWFAPLVINNSEPLFRRIESSELKITCKASIQRRYLSRCTLTFYGGQSRSDGFYKVQVINEHGEDNFTIAISYGKGLMKQQLNSLEEGREEVANINMIQSNVSKAKVPGADNLSQ
ncbi:hypothetical protein C0Q70_12310 [Pomacea canaliculata]|uniref:Ig-like domain-containing protein n=1 Tax=Pomacea canaliculata TaxID=400727 RepID=A0A2T7P172_POMCA|nr:hypothetical protein C0Q70_12310 [Pomacea canaliculata]